jgi:DNA-binding transcriptional ArsR family regulator
MTGESKTTFERRAEILKALAHPTRLRVVDELSRGELCVAEITAIIGSDMSTVSRHLSQLRRAGILESERRGTCVYYRLKCVCVTGFFDCIESVIAAGAGSER